MRFQTTLLSCAALALLCAPLVDCSKKVVVNHYVAPAGDVTQQQRNMHVVYSPQYHERVVEYQDDRGAWLVAGMMIGGVWSPWNYPYTYWNPGYYNGWASQNQTNITYNNFGNTSAGTPVPNGTGTADVDATASGDPQSVVGTAAPSDDDYSNQGDVNVAPSSSSDDNSGDGTPAATSSSQGEDDGTPAATSASQGEDDGTPAATSSSQGEDDGAPAATNSDSSDDSGSSMGSSSGSDDSSSDSGSGSSGGSDEDGE
jgi:hypothetical protein